MVKHKSLGYGNGTIVKRGKHYFWKRTDDTGKRFQTVIKDSYNKSVQNKDLAYQIVLEKISEIKELETIRDKKVITLKIAEQNQLIKKFNLKTSEIWDKFLMSGKRPDSGESTLKTYKTANDYFVDWLSNDYPNVTLVDEITPDLAGEYMAYVWSTGISPRTFNKHLQALKLIFTTLFQKENAFHDIRPKKSQSKPFQAFNIQQLKSIYAVLADESYYMLHKNEMQTLLYIAIYTGARLSDCCLLKWENVAFDNNILRFKPTKTKNTSSALVTVPLLPPLKQELVKHLNNEDEYIIPHVAQRYCRNPSGISQDIKKLLTKAGIKTMVKAKDAETRRKKPITKYSFHSFRHTFASVAIQSGIGIETVRQILGHSHTSMTSHYTHIDDDTKRKALQAFSIFMDEGHIDHRKELYEAIKKAKKSTLQKALSEIIDNLDSLTIEKLLEFITKK